MPHATHRDDRAHPAAGLLRSAARWLTACLLWPLGVALAAPAVTLAQAERIEPDGHATTVTLPDWVMGPGVQQRLWRLNFEWRAQAGALALYVPGLLGHGRIAINGQTLFESLAAPVEPRPRGLNLFRVVMLPTAFLHEGTNRIEITLRAANYVSLSRVIVGDEGVLRGLHDRKAMASVYGPMLVATVIACLGASVLLIWLRRRGEPMYVYFAVGSIAWGLHTAWSVLPAAPLPGAHNAIWWNTLYALFVILLLNFALRFAGYKLHRLESALLATCAAAPLVFYAANAFGILETATNLWRLGLVLAAFGTLAAVARSAWRERNLDSSLLVVASFAAASFGLRDWLVFQRDDDNLPIALIPYSGLPLVVLVAWFLIDRFVRTTESLEGLNRELESRVEQKSVELTATLDRMRAARDEADAANQAKSSFLAAASHDLRQPIHALGLYLGALRQRPLDAAAGDIVQRMEGSLGAVDTMFNALLDISRMDAGAVQPQSRAFDLEAMLRRLAEEFAPQAAQRGLRLGVRIAATARARTAASDPMLFERVLRNLIGNAVKYTAEGGVLITCRMRGAAWRVEIWDTGPGIPAAEREHVFEEFYQAGNPERDRRSGLGLGLSIVRRITRLLGVPLALFSRPGRGTRFALDVPATDAAVLPPRALDAGGSLQGLVVAVIEDDPEVRESMRTLLDSWGCRAIDGSDAGEVLLRLHADDGEEALPPQAVIADLRLRGERDGLGEVAHLRARFDATLPALIVSGDSAPERVRLLQSSGLPWLSKPVPAARLRSWLLSVAHAVPGQAVVPTTRESAR